MFNKPEDEPRRVYRQSLRDGVFRLQQCRDCGKFSYPPAFRCRFCESAELRWTEPSGKGVVHSTVLNIGSTPVSETATMALIELEEGPRLLGPVLDVKPEELVIGLPVSVHIGMVSGDHNVVFYNKEQGSQEW